MSKLSIGLGIGLGVWASGMGVVALTGGSNKEMLPSSSWIVKLPFVKDITTKYKELPCVSQLFNEVEWKNQSGSTTIQSLTSADIEGCLVVWWDTESYEDNWKGSLNLLWGMKDSTSGMIFLSGIKANDGKVDENARLYTLKKHDNKWTSMPSSAALTEPKIKNKEEMVLPKKELMKSPHYLNFDFDFNKICSSTNICESESPKQIHSNLNWKFVSEKDTETPVYKFVENLGKTQLILIENTIQTLLSQVKGLFEPL